MVRDPDETGIPYEVVAREVVAFDGRRFAASGSGRFGVSLRLALDVVRHLRPRAARRPDELTPPMLIRADGSFSRAERFPVAYPDVFVRFRVRFAGRVSGESANGTLRMRASIYTRNRKRPLTAATPGRATGAPPCCARSHLADNRTPIGRAAP